MLGGRHKVPQVKNFPCTYCQKSYGTKQSLMVHISTNHRAERDRDREERDRLMRQRYQEQAMSTPPGFGIPPELRSPPNPGPSAPGVSGLESPGGMGTPGTPNTPTRSSSYPLPPPMNIQSPPPIPIQSMEEGSSAASADSYPMSNEPDLGNNTPRSGIEDDRAPPPEMKEEMVREMKEEMGRDSELEYGYHQAPHHHQQHHQQHEPPMSHEPHPPHPMQQIPTSMPDHNTQMHHQQ